VTDSKGGIGKESGSLGSSEHDGDEAVCATMSAGAERSALPQSRNSDCEGINQPAVFETPMQ